MSKRAAGEINICPKIRHLQKQVAVSVANSVMVLIVFRVKDTIFFFLKIPNILI